ncbi:MAG: hypothetical protein GY769_09660 [bacterium]|nr:hypothetical protein [bacterium]
MSRARSAFILVFVLLVLALPATAAAESSVYSFNLWAGVGGSMDEDEAGLSNSTYQLGFSVQPEDQLLVGLRVGELDLGGGLIGGSIDTSLDYATVVGEYRFTETFYESGLFIGLGLYSLDGVLPLGQGFTEESVGLALGISGEFVLTSRFGFLLELSGHLTNLDSVDTLVMGHAGVAIHF